MIVAGPTESILDASAVECSAKALASPTAGSRPGFAVLFLSRKNKQKKREHKCCTRDSTPANNQGGFQVCMEPTAIPKLACGVQDSGVLMACVDVGVFFLT